jgi:hypothetical protein
MNITKYSRINILHSMEYWHVPKDYADPMYNYLVHGFEPGGFFTAVLANDWMTAIQRSHPANTIDALKAVSSWIIDTIPEQCWGNYDLVSKWINATDDHRRAVLERHKLIFSEKEETWMALEGRPADEPILW